VLRALKDTRIYGGATGVYLSHPSVGGLCWHRRITDLRSGKYDGVSYRIDPVPIPGKRLKRYLLRKERAR